MSLEIEYIEKFGSKEAESLMNAAMSHNGDTMQNDHGNDSFIWAIMRCIGFQCVEKENYRKHHKIKVKWNDFKNFCLHHKDQIMGFTGDVDLLSLFGSGYDWLKEVNK